MVSLFDTDGSPATWGRIKAIAKTGYVWPQGLGIRPLETTNAKAIFVVGCGHSGTSLLANILGRSKDLFLVGYESGAFFPMRGYYASKEAARSWQNISRQLGYEGFVEKTPKHVHCIDRIRRVLPAAQFVAILRDGRDVMASFLKRGLSPEFAVKRWVDDNRAIIAAAKKGGVVLTSYEALVSDPHSEMSRLCEHLSVTFSEDMLSGSSSGYGWIEGQTMGERARQTAQRIYDGRGKWASELSASDLKIFWERAGPMMANVGYGPGPHDGTDVRDPESSRALTPAPSIPNFG